MGSFDFSVMLKRKWLALILTVACVGGLGVVAQVGSGKVEKLATRLKQALKLYPDADLDGDGKLTVDEGLVYLKKHPELRGQFIEMSKVSGESRFKVASYGVNELGPRVFVCGHSYMVFAAGMLPELSRLAEVPYRNAGQQMKGGSQVIQHWDLPNGKNEAKRSLQLGKVDVLLLSPNAILPDVGIENFTKLGLAKNADLRVLVQASWVPRDGSKGAKFKNAQRDGVTVEELQAMRRLQHEGWLKKLQENIGELNARYGNGREVIQVVRVCDAVYALREKIARGEAPGLSKQSELFKDDHGHPSAPLAWLVSYCHFAAIHQRSPVGLAVPEGLKSMSRAEELNRLLQELAWQAVGGVAKL